MLKKMNTTYPTTSQDFDGQFVRNLMRSIFNAEELKECSENSSLLCINRSKMKLARGNILWSNYNSYNSIKKKSLWIRYLFTAIYGHRVGNDRNRYDSFRNHTFNIGKQ